MSVLASACALLGPLAPPAGFTRIDVVINNASLVEIRPAVRANGTDIPGTVEPPVIPPQTSVVATIYVPPTGDWSILAIPKGEYEVLGPCPVVIVVEERNARMICPDGLDEGPIDG